MSAANKTPESPTAQRGTHCVQRLVRRYRIARVTPTHVYVMWQEKPSPHGWATRRRKLTHHQLDRLYSRNPPNDKLSHGHPTTKKEKI
jgi:hypothetical protein